MISNYTHAQSLTSYTPATQQFIETLNNAGVNTETLLEQDYISRYDTARLLNIIECQDCINPTTTMQQSYDQLFWDEFTFLENKDFDDIEYGSAEFE